MGMIKLISSLEKPLGSRPSSEDHEPNMPEKVYNEEEIMQIKHDAKMIFRTLTVPTSRVPDPGQKEQACCLWAKFQPESAVVVDCVAFHEVLSGLCTKGSVVDIDKLKHSSAFKDLVARKNNIKIVKKAVKASQKNAYGDQNGDRFTCQEVSAALLVEASWRGRNERLRLAREGLSNKIVRVEADRNKPASPAGKV